MWFAVQLSLALLAGGTGCGGRDKGAVEDNSLLKLDFVQIDDPTDAELSELDGIELQQVTAECGNLLELEPAARLGRLTEVQVRCLNEALDEAQRQTAKDKISRLLLGDAWAKGDIHRWMGVAARHLDQVERADPDLVYHFAYNLVQIGNPERMDEAIHWAEIALENKSFWEGEEHVRRVYGLYKIRTLAAFKKWEYLEARNRDALASQQPSEQLQHDAEAARNELKTYAREWLDYAKSANRDVSEPMRLCAMAAGTEAFCLEDG